ncbi:hypothetical protein [Actinoplanes sp. RD1]|uniref:hypothetical protein n=1 Tax=Actinoplanes sp. RD1 TaxID=3064538 RepID=UPI002741AD28|nr:hypothetical protein [Actinoplanes sp. RD1]
MTDDLTGHAQPMTDQPDGPGKRIGKKGELTIVTPLTPNGGKIFRERQADIQAKAGYWEPIVATVENFRIQLFDDDTRMIITLVYDGDFLPYLADIGRAHPWLDELFLDVVDGYKGYNDPGTKDLVVSRSYSADVFFHANPDKTVNDVKKMSRLSDAFAEMLDAAS